jgi:hypothetical protein
MCLACDGIFPNLTVSVRQPVLSCLFGSQSKQSRSRGGAGKRPTHTNGDCLAACRPWLPTAKGAKHAKI